jgi:hypothetical protein
MSEIIKSCGLAIFAGIGIGCFLICIVLIFIVVALDSKINELIKDKEDE